MPEGDSFDSWLSSFSKEVDSALQGAGPPAPASPEARGAQDSFDRWWKTEQQPVTEPVVRFDPAPVAPPPSPAAAAAAPAPHRDALLPEEWPARLEKLAEDRARLQQRCDGLETENRALKERQGSVQTEIADFEAKLSRSRRSYEEHIEQLDAKVRALEAKLQEKQPQEQELARAKQQLEAEAAQLAAERDRSAESDRQLLDLRQRLAVQESQLAQARQDLAAQAGAVTELRQQASVYQHRLVQSKESTDGDVMTMRMELKTFLEDLRLIRNTMRKGEAA